MRWNLLGLLAIATDATGVEPAPTPMASYRAESYTTSDGLGNESLLHVTRLHDGRVVISGVSGEPLLFDGHRFAGLPYTPPTSFSSTGALSTLESSDGAIWIASSPGGLLHFRAGELHTLALPDEASRPFSLSLGRDGRRLLVPTNRGVFEFDSLQPQQAPRRLTDASLSATVVLEDREGALWIGSTSGLYRIAADTRKPVAFEQFNNIHIWTLFLDRRGRVLIGTRGLGLMIYAEGVFQQVSREQGLPHDIVRSVAELDDALWIATAGGGIARYDGQRISVFNTSNGLSSDTVTWLTADEKGVLWAATAGAGLNRLWPSAFTTYADAQGKRGGFHYAIHRDRDGGVWIGSNLGLAQWRDDVLLSRGQPAQGQAGTVLGIVDHPQGGLLLATRRGLFHYQGGRYLAVAGAAEMLAPVMLRTSSLGLVIGSGHRVYAFDGIALQLLATLPDATAQIQNLHEDSSYGLLLASNRGAFAYDGREVIALGPRGRRAGGFWRDGDRLYISGSSLAVLEGRVWTELGESGGPSRERALYNIVPDRMGGVWVTSRDGLLRYERAALRRAGALTLPEAVVFGLRDGLPSTEFEGSPQGVLSDSDGSLWLASTGGISRLQPERVARSPESIQLALHALDNEEHRYLPKTPLQLPPGTRRVALSFSALPASHSDAVQIRYRLLPIEQRYRSDRGQREAVYGGLGPGDYQFELIGDVPGLNPVSGRTTFAFAIQPRPLERTSVQIALVVSGFVLLAALPTLHIRALRRQRRRLIDEVAAKTAALEALAHADSLTGLDNRRRFDAALAAALSDSAAHAGLVLIDVDHFKKYNDSLGHQAGDECLRQVAAAMAAQALLHNASVARVGGEEFAALMTDSTASRLQQFAHALRESVAQLAMPHPASDGGNVSISLGIAMAQRDEGADSLLRRADAALYRAKQLGRNRVESA